MRDLLKMSDQEIEAAFAKEFDLRVRLSGDECTKVVFTLDTLQSFIDSAGRYHEYSNLEKVNNAVVIEKARVHKRDQVSDIFVIDFGEVRAYYRR